MKSIRYLILIIVLFFGCNYSFAQQNKAKSKEQKKIEKQQAKEEVKKQEEERWHELYELFKNKDIVFHGKRYDGINVSPEINFIKIYGDSVIIQFANGIGGGQNGIGGYTGTGWIDSYKLGKKKSGKSIELTILIRIQPGQGLRSPLVIGISAYSFDSSRIIIGAYSGYMYGFIRSNINASIFKGNTPN